MFGNLRKGNRTTIIFFVFIIFFLAMLLAVNLNKSKSIIRKEKIEAFAMVGDKYGLAINGTALIFGRIVPGGSSTKKLTIDNNYNTEVRVEIFSKGPLGKYLQVSDNDFILKDNEKKTVKFSTHIPKDLPHGNYTGEVYIVVRKNNLLNRIF